MTLYCPLPFFLSVHPVFVFWSPPFPFCVCCCCCISCLLSSICPNTDAPLSSRISCPLSSVCPNTDVALSSCNPLADSFLSCERHAAGFLSWVSALAACRKAAQVCTNEQGTVKHFNFLKFNMFYILFYKSLR